MSKPFSQIPLLPGADWMGHLREMNRDRLGFISRFNTDASDVARIQVFNYSVVLAHSPAAIRDVLVSQADGFHKSPVQRSAMHPLAGLGLFTSEDALWRRQRRLMAPLFQPQNLAGYAESMANCAERTVSTWQDGQDIDLAAEMTRITMDVAGKTLFDVDTTDDADALGHALTDALEWINQAFASPALLLQMRVKTAFEHLAARTRGPLRTWSLRLAEALHAPLRLPTRRTRAMHRAIARLERRVAEMIAQRRAARQPPDDLMSRLLFARDEDDGGTMSDRQIRDEVLTLFVAGHETTATGLAWTLHLLMQHPDVHARCLAEAEALPGPSVRFEDIPRLSYTQMVIKEALRLYPPIYMFARQTQRAVRVGAYEVPAGRLLLLSPYALHRNPRIWPEPECFRPERFTPEEEKARPRGVYLPFSTGPRVCIASRFALIESQIILATVLRRFALEPLQAEVQPEPTATLRPRGGVWARVRRRHPVESTEPAPGASASA